MSALDRFPSTVRTHLETLRSLSPYGLLVVAPPGQEPLYCWWGDRQLSLAATSRLAYGINVEMDEDEGEAGGEDDDQLDLFKPLPLPFGQYL